MHLHQPIRGAPAYIFTIFSTFSVRIFLAEIDSNFKINSIFRYRKNISLPPVSETHYHVSIILHAVEGAADNRPTQQIPISFTCVEWTFTPWFVQSTGSALVAAAEAG
jgi:hypothetical protein